MNKARYCEDCRFKCNCFGYDILKEKYIHPPACQGYKEKVIE
jgi:hypothetical protein